MQLDEQFYVTDRTKLRQWLPWLHLFRSFRIAIGVRPLVLAITAALLIDVGGQLISTLPFAVESAARSDWTQPLTTLSPEMYATHPAALAVRPLNTLDAAARHAEVVIGPLWTVIGPGQALFQRGNSWSTVAVAWTMLLWSLIVWGIFGVAVSRMAAMRFATESSVPMRESLRYSLRKLTASVGAPLLPMAGVGGLWLLCLTVGLVGRIPSMGPMLVGVFWWLPLLLSGTMTLILLALAAGWPLMLSSIGTEDADAFDAFGRVYNYVFSRPWYALWLVIVALVYGSLLLTFVATIIDLLIPLSEWAVASGLGDAQTAALLHGSDEGTTFATAAVQFWQKVTGIVLVGFVTSYFWTATTGIYFLLRLSVDATPLDAVSEPIDAPPDSLPLVGAAAAGQREADKAADTSESSSASSDEA